MWTNIYYWEQWEIDEIVAPRKEFIGLHEGPNQFHRRLCAEWVAYYEDMADQFATMKTIAPFIQDYMAMTVTGHEDAALNCDDKLITDAAALLNIIPAMVYEELTELKNPVGESEYMQRHHQSVSAEKYWNKYAGRVVQARWRGQYYDIDAYQHGFEEGETVVVRFNLSYPVVGLDGIITDGAKYKVGVKSEDSIFLRTMDGVVIPIPRNSSAILLISRENTTPILHLKMDASYLGMSIMSVECDLIGLYDNTGEFYIITSKPVLTSSYIQFTASKFTMFAEGQTFYEYPTPHEYNVVHWSIKDNPAGQAYTTQMSVNLTGRGMQAPTEFGLSFQYLKQGAYWLGVKMKVQPLSFGQLVVVSEEMQEIFKTIPRGFYMFASQYYDHPIVTGVDSYPLIERSEAEELALVQEINAYVNGAFTYRTDFSEDWSFMGSGRNFGDCEDFALTKMQMLLDAGVSITRLQFDGGYTDELGYSSGHAWVLYRGQYALDTSSNALLSVGTMVTRFPRRVTQISGLVWVKEGVIKALPRSLLWPVHHINVEMFSFDMLVRKLMN